MSPHELELWMQNLGERYLFQAGSLRHSFAYGPQCDQFFSNITGDRSVGESDEDPVRRRPALAWTIGIGLIPSTVPSSTQQGMYKIDRF